MSLLHETSPQIIEHLATLIRAQLEQQTLLKGVQDVEVFSHYLRSHKFNFKQLLEDKTLHQKVNTTKQYSQYIQALQRLVQKLNKINHQKPYLRSDVIQEYHALKVAGITVGETNAHYLQQVIKTLASQHEVKNIRFWGKILGYKDYYVIQASSNKSYTHDLPENSEKYGVGVNMYSYWVATSILAQWTQLPLVTPDQIITSRKFKYMFTGKLDNQIKNFTFPGKEKHLLKCILARITHSCELAPKGLYKLNEENPTIVEYQEQFKQPEVSEMNSLDSWVHLNPNILLQGRCTYYVDPKLTEEQKEAFNAELAEKDPLVQRFKAATEDKPYQALGYTTNWTNAIAGQTVPINQIGKQEGTTLIYGVAVLRNLAWPGAATVGYRGGWTNIYVGYGHRISQQYLSIKQLKDIQSQGQDKAMRSQPNPSKAVQIQQKKQQAVSE